MFDWLAGGLGLLNFIGGERANDASADQAQANRDFQERMSNTAYQRAVTDMKSAGLNPMLAYSQGPASTPGGAQAEMKNTLGPAANTALSTVRLREEVASLQAQREKTLAETRLVNNQASNVAADTIVKETQVPQIQASTGHSLASTKQIDFQIKNLEVQNKKLHAEIENLGKDGYRIDALVQNIFAQTKNLNMDTLLKSVQRGLVNAQIKLTGAENMQLVSLLSKKLDLMDAEVALRRNQVPEAAAKGDFYSSSYGRASPYIESILGNTGALVGSAVGAAAGARFGLRKTPYEPMPIGSGKVSSKIRR